MLFSDIDVETLTSKDRNIIKVECYKGHEFSVALTVFREGLWCIKCDGINKAYNLIAKSNKGEVMEIVKTTKELVSLKCEKDHCWNGRYVNLKKGYWCKKCSDDKKRFKPEDIINLAVVKGGECLSDLNCYTNCQKEKLLWRCSEGHEWRTTVFSVKQGGWCKKCSCNSGSLEEVQNYAESKGGKCLSTFYKNTKTFLEFQCSEGHKWTTNLGNIRFSKPWCSKCNNMGPYTKKDMEELANKKGGKFLSKKYTKYTDKFLWECEYQHQWMTSAQSVLKDRWCPRCNEKRTQSKGSSLIQNYLDENQIIFMKEKEFDGCSYKKNLRFDFWLPDEEILVEYDGIQHFEEVKYWGGMEKFQLRINCDCIKGKYCLDNKITLIRISYQDKVIPMLELLLKKAQQNIYVMQPLIRKEYKGHVNGVFTSKTNEQYATYFK